MAFSKAHYFPPSDFHLATLCRALSHPARIAILRHLIEVHSATAKELCGGMPLCPASASQHLTILREMRILNYEQKYPTVKYWLNPALPVSLEILKQMILHCETTLRSGGGDEVGALHRLRAVFP